MGLLGYDDQDLSQGLLSFGQMAAQRRPFLGLLAGLAAADRSQAGRAEMQRQAGIDERKLKLDEEMKRMQIAALQQAQAQQAQAMQRQQAIEEAYRGAFRTPQQAAMQMNGGPTVAAANAAQNLQPMLDQQALVSNLMKVDPVSAAAMLQPKPDDFKVVGDSLVRIGGGKVSEAYRAPPKPESSPAAIREYEYAVQQGYKGSFQQFQLEQRRAGATNVSVNTEKPLLNTIAGGLGNQLDAGLAAARAAVTSINTAQTLRQAAESGKILAGPGANFGVLGLQLGNMLGVTGKDANERLLNTRMAIQSMAKAELDAAQMMKGQGQITEAERDIIRRAAAGDINSLTAPELSLLAQAMEKTGRAKIAAHQANVQNLGRVNGAAPLMPFYQVEAPPEIAPQGWGIRPIPGGK